MMHGYKHFCTNSNRIESRWINWRYKLVMAILGQRKWNLTNYTKTPIHRVLETVRSEAARYGVAVAGTELIGSVPLGALEDVVRFYLQTHEFSTDQVVETALLD